MTLISLHNKSDISYTQIPNIFIDEYMSRAHGAYVKVYLALSRLLSRPDIELTVSTIADMLDLTDNDVIRAINYWEKNSLLDVKRTNTGAIYDIGILNPSSDKIPSNINFVISYPDNIDTETINAASSEEDFKWLTGIIEKYMERTLSSTDVDLLVYLYETLHFSSDLILHLYEYCIEKGKKSTSYIQKVALNWANKGVKTVSDAKELDVMYNRDYLSVMKAFGINNPPAPAQKEFIDTWYSYGFDSDIIIEACNRTMLSVNEPNFRYANGILEYWRTNNLFSMEDIMKADKVHNSGTTGKQGKNKSGSNRKGSFNSFDQRKYSPDDYSSLEQQLLEKK